jgi:hypothetical protein
MPSIRVAFFIGAVGCNAILSSCSGFSFQSPDKSRGFSLQSGSHSATVYNSSIPIKMSLIEIKIIPKNGNLFQLLENLIPVNFIKLCISIR